jgi:hypothetical protein
MKKVISTISHHRNDIENVAASTWMIELNHSICAHSNKPAYFPQKEPRILAILACFAGHNREGRLARDSIRCCARF